MSAAGKGLASDAEALRAVDGAVSRGGLKALPAATVSDVYLPLAKRLIAAKAGRAEPLCVAISGTPGTGKSTLAAYLGVLCQALGNLRTASFSLDDLYLGRAQRAALSKRVHQLFVTRGVPGTHDLALGHRTLAALRAATPETLTPLPRFNKLQDEPELASAWPCFAGRPELILVDSWFWRIAPASKAELMAAVNPREEKEDSNLVWRTAVNDFLSRDYPRMFAETDLWVHLSAPSWDATVRWRVQQQKDLLSSAEGAPLGANLERDIRRFLQLFQRWGELPHAGQPDFLLQLREDHSTEPLD